MAHPYNLTRAFYRAQTQIINKRIAQKIQLEGWQPLPYHTKANLEPIKPEMINEAEGKPLDKWRYQHLMAYLFEFRHYHKAFTHMKRLYVSVAGVGSIVPAKVRNKRRRSLSLTLGDQTAVRFTRLEQKYAQDAMEKLRRMRNVRKRRGHGALRTMENL